MQNAVAQMLDRYDCRSADDTVRALREILQEVALLGLWRSKFFEKAAFYGGTALRILYGLDRFSEDLDFSLLEPDGAFELQRYAIALEQELKAFGFAVSVEQKNKSVATAVQSAFLKTNTVNQLLVIQAGEEIARQIPPGQVIRIKLEVDTDPPPGFITESRYLLRPIPFSVRTYALPDLFAGKMHALLCRRWKNRVKGRDWYDLVWYCARQPNLHLAHLEQRLRQSGHWQGTAPLTEGDFRNLLLAAIEELNVDQARAEVLPFVRQPQALDLWSREFFASIARNIVIV
ncbi:nucleotidyl transferase AbiEii/AbiGii toxin family protein [Desulfuromonas thiophila]|uniref:nucleotidyl transferase AbiEii/AbiGii toxin family protein n=1 Tax=Desulfuromonas thiophila TaxID=57664 RepID=UPI0024A96143|nr:nucleotidyl transferase AbiEii/AbiGii toxin family protein [Desulfuromonas thiophila]